MKINTPTKVLPKEAEASKNFQEATELMKEKKVLLDTLMAAMGDGLSIQDLDMRIVYQNKFMVDHFGDHVGDYCYKIYEKRDKICEGCPIIEAYKDGKTHKALRVGQTKEGPFRFENIASVLKNKQGKIVAGMELCRIVEERERTLEELKEKTAELEKLKTGLEQAVAERTKTLEKKLAEIEQMNKLMVGRELKMTEMKKELEELKGKIGSQFSAS